MKGIQIVKRIVLGLTLVALVGSTAVQAQKMGHVDTQSILNDMPQKDSVEKSVKAFKAELDKEIQEMQIYYQKKLNGYLAERDSLSNSMRQIREEELRELEEKIYAKQEENQERIAMKQNTAIQKLIEIIKGAIDRVAKAQGLNYVIDVSYLLSSQGGNDITALVRKEMKLPPASTGNTTPGNK